MIDFSHDPVVTKSIQQWRSREHFTTDFSSADIRGLSRQLRERSIFSARTTNAEYLQHVADTVDELLAGKINVATGRLRLMRKLKELGYDPEVGFPQDMAQIPPAERGSLRDLSSEMRIDLMLKTNVAMARNYGRVVGGNTPEALYAFPAWELIRLGVRQTPRGAPDSHSVGWQRRWHAAGESVAWVGAVQSPMVALKDSPIWQALGDGEGGDWHDTLGNPYPPFAFNSGMDWRAVPREEWMEHRTATGAHVSPTTAPMEATIAPTAAELADRFAKLAPDLRAALESRWAT
jgi:hypothetical protein